MDAEQTLEFMRQRNRADIELPSGLGATIGLVRLQDCVVTGALPLSVLKEMDKIIENSKKNGKAKPAPEPSPEVIERGAWLRREIVRRTLKRLAPSVSELAGPDVDLSMKVVDELDQADFNLIAAYGMRETSFPKASVPT